MCRRYFCAFFEHVTKPSLRSNDQTRPQATKYYESKVDFIRNNLEALQETIQKKQENMGYLTNVMQAKLQAETAGEKKK